MPSVQTAVLDAGAGAETRRLYERHRQRIFAYCLSRLGNRHDAEDAVQTTFLYVLLCLERGTVPEAELPWLFTIAHNACRTRRRTLGRRRRIEAPVELESCQIALPTDEPGDEALARLKDALAALPRRQQRALILREWHGLSYAEIAEALAVSQSAVETLLFRARRSVAATLRRAPERVAVMLNLPLLLRMVRRAVAGSDATRAAAAAVAVGVAAVATADRPPRVPSRQVARGAQTAAPSAPAGGGERVHVAVVQTPIHAQRPAVAPRQSTAEVAGATPLSPESSVASAAPAAAAPAPATPAVNPDGRTVAGAPPAPPASAAPPSASSTPPPATSSPLVPALPTVPAVPAPPSLPLDPVGTVTDAATSLVDDVQNATALPPPPVTVTAPSVPSLPTP
jgi:RNA polymerase sigma factor (sigma-70 family)